MVRFKRNITSKQYYCKSCRRDIQKLTCDRCNCEYEGVPKMDRHHFCNKCLKNEASDLQGISSRTLTRIWALAKLPCSICGWDECSCDIHHIIELSKGGLDSLDNLISLCPNCHRKAHNGLFELEYLKGRSLKDFDVSLYYDKQRSERRKKNKYNVTELDRNDLLKMTGRELSEKYDISKGLGILLRFNEFGHTRIRKFNPTKEELELLVQEKPMTEIGKIFGVSDNAVKKRCKRLGIELKPMRGHWMKVKAEKI